MKKTVIIVPCYNEAQRLNTKSFASFIEQNPHFFFFFVNDGSHDTTATILNDFCQKYPNNTQALHLNQNSGKAEAVRQGFLKAFSKSPALIGFLDADLSAPLECLSELESCLNNSRKEIAMGARVALLGRQIQRNPSRHYIGRTFATAVSCLLGLRVYDTQCGAKLFRSTPRLEKIFAAPFTTKWIFDVEILGRFVLTEKEGFPPVKDICVELPLQRWEDIKGSKLRFKDFLTSGLDLIKIIQLMRKKSCPTS